MADLALLYKREKKYELSEKYLKLAIANDDIEALYGLSVIYEEQGNYKDAKYYAELALKKNHPKAETMLNGLKELGY